MSAGIICHAAAGETPMPRPRKRVEAENGTGRRMEKEKETEAKAELESEQEHEIVIGIGIIAYSAKKQKFQPKREPGEIGNQTAPKNGNPNQS